jgi:diguanylate cyclase (GGDEF)-like protein/PAS domain S-box-containing protein
MPKPEHKKFASNLMEHLVTATFVLDRDGKIMIWNRSCERLTGVPASEVVGTRDHWKAFYSKKRECLADIIVQGRADELNMLYAVHAEPSIHGNGYKAENWCVMPRAATRLYLAADAGPVYDEHGTLIAVVQTIRDGTDYKNAQFVLEELAVTDELTGLHNRRFFNEHLNKEWSRGIRSREPLSVIFLDIDYFKQYNDTYGHVAGDECLKSIASVLQRSLLRSSDMATRYGGEEFCLLLPNTSLDGAFNIAQRIRLAIATLNIPHSSSSISDTVTLSDGIACFVPSSHDTPSQLVTLADEALYEAKALGRNQSVKKL